MATAPRMPLVQHPVASVPFLEDSVFPANAVKNHKNILFFRCPAMFRVRNHVVKYTMRREGIVLPRFFQQQNPPKKDQRRSEPSFDHPENPTKYNQESKLSYHHADGEINNRHDHLTDHPRIKEDQQNNKTIGLQSGITGSLIRRKKSHKNL